tara:strand:+ start:495 stop:1106 length:612 start_codon:yes stop_codon:yes gene_type:complete
MSSELLKLLEEVRKRSLICNPLSWREKDWIPECVIEYFAPFYQDKIFCDIGCYSGSIALSASRFSKKSIGIELVECVLLGGRTRDKILDYANRQDTNIELFYGFDALDRPLPVADFYIMNLPYKITLRIIEKIEKSGMECMILICSPTSGGGCAPSWKKEEAQNFLKNGSFSFFYYDEIVGKSRIIAFKDYSGKITNLDKPSL